MSDDINRVTIIGRLTRDSERMGARASVLRFSIASNRRVKSGNEWKDEPGFFDCICFGKQAENLAKYLTKGKRIAVDGSLRWYSWEKDGQKRSKVDIACDSVQFLDAREQGQSQPGPSGFDDSSIPF